jgi:hypothetical protein
MPPRHRQRESAVLVFTDPHYGKKTTTFNTGVFNRRLDKVGASMGRIRELLKGYDFDELVVMALGDVNDGSEIYPTQPHHQEVSNVNKQAMRLSERLAPWLVEQKKVWGHVRVECVPGNHGRAGKWAHEAANWDMVTYEYLRLRLAGQGIAVNVNAEADNIFIRKVGIRGHQYVLYHGHDIRTFSNIPWYGMMLRISRWLSTKIAPFDVALMGHFHSFGTWKINQKQLFLSGTMVTDDDWALQTLGWESAAKWWLFGVSNKYPVTWQFGIDLE